MNGINGAPDHAEDYDLCLRLSEVAQVGRVQKPLYYYRIHSSSTSQQLPITQILRSPRLNSDIYALGMVGIEALTGIPPKQFQRDPNGELVFKTDSNPNAVVWYQLGNFSQKLATILEKMVAYDFMKRYQSAQEVLQSLERIELARR